MRRGVLARDRRGARFARRRAAPPRRCSPRQCAAPPADAARATARIARATGACEYTRVTVAERGRVRQQILVDAQLDLAADRRAASAHEIERAADRALGRILDRHDGVVGLPALGGAKHLVDRRRTARASTNVPKCLATAAWLNVPAGPRYAMRIGCSSARHADMISRNTPVDRLVRQRTRVFGVQAATAPAPRAPGDRRRRRP